MTLRRFLSARSPIEGQSLQQKEKEKSKRKGKQSCCMLVSISTGIKACS